VATEIPSTQTICLAGQRFVILPEAQYRDLVQDTWEPPLPQADAAGNYPALDAARVILARKILRRRRSLGLSGADLARRAGVRVETISRLEHAKHTANVATIDKIIRALEQAEAEAKPRAPTRKARKRK
jgi:DNA-binding XRE family transcriptional regulator